MHHGVAIHELHEQLMLFVRLLKQSATQAPVDQSAMLLLWPLLNSGPMRLRDLAVSKGVDASTASRQVDQLVQAGLVRREPDPVDGRARLLVPTDLGKSVCQQVLDARRKSIEEALRDWPAEKIHVFADLLRDFNRAVDVHQRPETPTQPVAPGGVTT